MTALEMTACEAHPLGMNTSTDMSGFLDGRLLIAMPGMIDPRFDRSVIFMCAHSGDGAMGLIVNKPAEGLAFADLLEQLDIPRGDQASEIRVHLGGPVEHGRGFVLHSAEYEADGATLEINDDLGMTASVDILRDIALGDGPERALLALGYAGWGPGQLEGELQQNGWLICEADDALIFSADDGGKWERALGLLGIDARTLSASGGRA